MFCCCTEIQENVRHFWNHSHSMPNRLLCAVPLVNAFKISNKETRLIDQVHLKLKVKDSRTRLLDTILMSFTLKAINELFYFFVDFEDVWACVGYVWFRITLSLLNGRERFWLLSSLRQFSYTEEFDILLYFKMDRMFLVIASYI